MIQIDYTVTLRSPLRVATGIGRAGWLDNTVTRDADGQPLLPGSSLKGRTRAAAFRLARGLGAVTHAPSLETSGCSVTEAPCLICRIFGAAQWPGRLHFADSHLDPRLANLLASLDHLEHSRQDTSSPAAGLAFGRVVRSNTAIDRRRRVVLPGRLFTYEAIDSTVTFVGTIEGEIRDAAADHGEIALLVAALESITHLGGAKGRGMGRCTITAHPVRVDGVEIERASLGNALNALGGTP